MEVRADAQSALGMLEREGVWKVRHVDVGILWLQQKWSKTIVEFHKVPGSENTADMMTKALGREKGDQFVDDMNGEFRVGRAGKAVQLQGESAEIRIIRNTRPTDERGQAEDSSVEEPTGCDRSGRKRPKGDVRGSYENKNNNNKGKRRSDELNHRAKTGDY